MIPRGDLFRQSNIYRMVKFRFFYGVPHSVFSCVSFSRISNDFPKPPAALASQLLQPVIIPNSGRECIWQNNAIHTCLVHQVESDMNVSSYIQKK